MSKEKVLIIDDDPGVAKLNETLLTSKGFDVVIAVDGDEGLAKAKEEAPDVILLDIILPKIHGFEVCKMLKQDADTKNIPVIIVTASGLEEIAESEEDIIAEGYMAKPYGIEDLLSAIQQAKEKIKEK